MGKVFENQYIGIEDAFVVYVNFPNLYSWFHLARTRNYFPEAHIHFVSEEFHLYSIIYGY